MRLRPALITAPLLCAGLGGALAACGSSPPDPAPASADEQRVLDDAAQMLPANPEESGAEKSGGPDADTAGPPPKNK